MTLQVKNDDITVKLDVDSHKHQYFCNARNFNDFIEHIKANA